MVVGGSTPQFLYLFIFKYFYSLSARLERYQAKKK